ncbi:hypothetical protein [Fusibacter tunisiensis]|uniref:Uncharacterized protein YpmB n=1 Tax=Fusibacter tunisiensis TaxID=1008308 RepID=A0ABS2MPX6_9FIRM|nr:hypothetical protein [Fusibacter tunisiensis]MBM7561443.1 uncharacterized protein YpmB [Fusibacter tunisiensis]
MSPKKKIFIICIIVLVLSALFQFRGLMLAVFEEWKYHAEASNANRISTVYQMDVLEKEKHDKNYLYIGVDSETNQDKFVYVLFMDKKAHVIYAHEGISYVKAKQIGLDNGYEVNTDKLLVWQSYTKEKSNAGDNIANHMYWLVFEDPYEKNVYINFTTGEIMVR